MTESEHAEAIREAATALNYAVARAVEAGLTVELDQLGHTVVGKRNSTPVIAAYVNKVID